MSLLGPIQDGLTGDIQILAIKSVMDGISTMTFATTFGWSVPFAAGPVLLIRAHSRCSRVRLNNGSTRFPSALLLDSITATGGFIVLCIPLLLLIRRIQLADYLPALIIAPAAVWIFEITPHRDWISTRKGWPMRAGCVRVWSWRTSIAGRVRDARSKSANVPFKNRSCEVNCSVAAGCLTGLLGQAEIGTGGDVRFPGQPTHRRYVFGCGNRARFRPADSRPASLPGRGRDRMRPTCPWPSVASLHHPTAAGESRCCTDPAIHRATAGQAGRRGHAAFDASSFVQQNESSPTSHSIQPVALGLAPADPVYREGIEQFVAENDTAYLRQLSYRIDPLDVPFKLSQALGLPARRLPDGSTMLYVNDSINASSFSASQVRMSCARVPSCAPASTNRTGSSMPPSHLPNRYATIGQTPRPAHARDEVPTAPHPAGLVS